jgi:hypothetical protein
MTCTYLVHLIDLLKNTGPAVLLAIKHTDTNFYWMEQEFMG